jgi:hypothetical protein
MGDPAAIDHRASWIDCEREVEVMKKPTVTMKGLLKGLLGIQATTHTL